ncbi:hypothetical protein [Amycolatopsis saalfeldensis]|uniref:Uncharacterized protein n=1 Tax=Amycolatopsis saalfeldensis TaxID=394193 RepID=A0A1H8YC26_9PSEU|nr:hypothetical protein [Amycolatopsis saalfeldensis]SEP49636.1 hypothetical protein SAMN04489732_113130 [Amycolatopsis saalfeldensis]
MSSVADPGQATNALAAGGLNSQTITAVTAETTKLVDAAKSGGFTISGEALGDLRKALTDMATRLDHMKAETQILASAPQLGSHPYGHTVAAHDQKGGADATGSATVVLEQFGQVLKDADEALARAAGVYTDNEGQAFDASKTRH